MEKQLRIVYMGTPEFAVSPLEALLDAGYNVVGVVTVPDKPAGRGYKLQESAVKKKALERKLPILQPEKLKDPKFLEQLNEWKPDLQVVVAFRMLPKEVWDLPSKGTFNLHASLLPQYRGAAPINWAIINGEQETGVTTFFLDSEIDTGYIIDQERTKILDQDNLESLYNRLMEMGAKLVVKTVNDIEKGTYRLQPQTELMKHIPVLFDAPKIFRETCQIDWNKGARGVFNLVRGVSPYPGAWSILRDPNGNEETIKIFEVQLTEEIVDPKLLPGSVILKEKGKLKIVTGDGIVEVISLQTPGRKKVNVKDYLNGSSISEAHIFI